MNLRIALMLGGLLMAPTAAAADALWLRYPAISPDGTTILFSYKGDIYSVPAGGGAAAPLTVSDAYDYAPVWSHDGRRIAFASDRHGNFDVFVMPAAGGEARRLTFHSTGETPSSFTADDTGVLFSAYRADVAANVQYPTPMMSELYRVPVDGGRVTRVLPVPALDATTSSDGGRILYHDVKGYESPWRKHHTSSVTRDIWVYETKGGRYTQLSTFAGEDRNPVFGSDDDTFYFLSEQGGSFNVYQSSLREPGRATALTRFTRHPVRFLTRARDNTLCFQYDGSLYTLKPGGEPVRVSVTVAVDGRETLDRIVPVNESFTEMRLSPNGKEFAYVFRGEIFVSAVDGGQTRRITNTPWQERSLSFSPDGRTLAYAAEADESWNVHTTTITRKEEPYFYLATLLETTPVVATAAEEYQPAFSPDGKEIAYLEERVTLRVVNLATKTVRTIMGPEWNYSYADGDQYFQWSPDGKWFLVQFGHPSRIFNPEVGLVSAAGGGEILDLTHDGYDDGQPKWVMDGKAMIWGSNRQGARAQGGDPVTGDVYALYFTRAAFERSKLSAEEFALLKEQEEKDGDGDAKGKDKDKAGDAPRNGKKAGGGKSAKGDDRDAAKLPVVEIERDRLTTRTNRLTTHTSAVGDWLLSRDGETLYYLTRFEKGNNLWKTELRKGETKLFAELDADGASMELSADGKTIVVLADGKPWKVDAESGDAKALKVSGEMLLRAADERAYIFAHSWRQLKKKFYDPGLHGVDWESYRAAYSRFLPHISNNHDFAEMLSELLGEMNASHTGCSFRYNPPNAPQTAALGLFYDDTHTGDGLKVAEVLPGGPLDVSTSKVRAGHVIERIDGTPLTARIDFYDLLNRRAGKPTLLSLHDPASGARWDESVKPITGGDEGELLYRRWVDNRRAEVDRLSGGRLGYVHVRSMSDASMRVVFSEALGRAVNTEGLIVDTRFNGGGNIHEQLSDFLVGRKYFDIVPHGQYIGSQPYDKWTKPSIVLMGESNYSDAHLFPVAYKVKGGGKTLGMPVPGTGTFVWWERQIDRSLVFGIPMGGWRTMDGRFCENNQLEPDVKVRLDPEVMTTGRDQQIEAAVRELLRP